MKKITFSILCFLTPLFMMAQGILKGDMNDDNEISVGDVTSVVRTALGQQPYEYISDPTKPNTTALAGTWRTGPGEGGKSLTLNTDGTMVSSVHGEAKKYEYYPYRGLLLMFDEKLKIVEAYDVLQQTEAYLLLCPKGTKEYTYYYEGSSFVSGILLNESTLTLKATETETLTATITPATAAIKTLSWDSSNEKVATVDQNGKVTAIGGGICTITAKSIDGTNVSASCAVTVTQPVSSITLNRTTLDLNPGGTATLSPTVAPQNATNKSLNWDSSEPKIATVDQNGVVTAVAVGDCKIICSAEDGSGVNTECIVNVAERVPVAVASIALNQSNVVMRLEDQAPIQIMATISPEDADNKNVAWESSDEAVATVDETGLVTAVSAGECTITCTSAENSEIKAACNVTVTESNDPLLVEKITLSESIISLNYKDEKKITATVTPSNADNPVVKWTSSDSKIISVDNAGNLTAKGLGTCTITCAATDTSKVVSTCTVTVKPFYKGHELVDLGITDASGNPIYWATCNVGASSPQLYGNYYAWGETSTKTTYDWNTYKHCNEGNKLALTRYCNSSSYGLPDKRIVLEGIDDAATYNWGEGWRTPSDAEIAKLRTECKWRWVSTYNGIQVNGYTVTGKKEGYTDKTIFIPAAGYYEGEELKSKATVGVYWSSSLYSDGYNYYSYILSIDASTWSKNRLNRCNGLTVRPVCQ